jgi:O-6-methylguanine DNA methyltransferase
MKLSRAIVSTPLGDMLALSSDEGLCALEFTGPVNSHRRSSKQSRRPGRSPGATAGEMVPAARNRGTRVEERSAAPERGCVRTSMARVWTWILPLDMRGAAFEKKVWKELLRIQPGETTSYGAIAKEARHTRARHAPLGLANGANPIAIVVPCHRVIGSTGSLTGYGGGLERKTWLIDHERQVAKRHAVLDPRLRISRLQTSRFRLPFARGYRGKPSGKRAARRGGPGSARSRRKPFGAHRSGHAAKRLQDRGARSATEVLSKPPKRLAAVAYRRFFFGRRFAQGPAQRRVEKNRVVAEPATAAWRSRDFAFDRPACREQQLVASHQRKRTNESGGARRLRNAAQLLVDQREFLRIRGGRSAISSRFDAGRTAERVDSRAPSLRQPPVRR